MIEATSQGSTAELPGRSAKDINIERGAGLNLGVRMLSYLLVGISGVILARGLGAHDRGLYSLITVMATYAGQLELGVSQAGIYLAGQKAYSLQQVAGNNVVVIPAIGLLWLMGCLVVAFGGFSFLPPEMSLGHVVVIGIGGLCLLLIAMSKDVVIASGNVTGFSLIDFCEPLLRSLLIGGGVLLFGFGLSGALSSWLAALVLTVLLAAFLMVRCVPLRPAFSPSISRRQFSFGMRNSAGYLVQGINSRIDVFIVAIYLGQTQLGYYAVAFSVAELLWQIPFAFSLMLFPKASALDVGGAADAASATCRRVLLVTLAGVIGGFATGHWVMGIYGSQYLHGLTAYYVLLPSALCYCVYKVLGSSLSARGRPETSLYSGLIALPITLGLGFYLIPRLGIEGAAITSLVAYTLNALVVLFLFCRLTGQTAVAALLVRRDDFIQVRSLISRSEVAS